MEHQLYKKIKHVELYKKAWNDKSQKGAPNVCGFIERFNKVSFWVASEIVAQSDFKKRAAVIKKFLSIAESCRDYHNYNGIMEICSGLHMSAIQRLKKTWKYVPKKFLNTLVCLTEIISNRSNYKSYRDALSSCGDKPAVPFIGVMTKDLTFIEDGNDDMDDSDNTMYNFDKLRMVSEVLMELINFQKRGYNFAPVPAIQSYLESALLKALDEEGLDKLSESLEPG